MTRVPYRVGETRSVTMLSGETVERTLFSRECDDSDDPTCFNEWNDGTIERERGFNRGVEDVRTYGATIVRRT